METVAVPFQIPPVSLRHMLRDGAVLSGTSGKVVRSDVVMIVKNFNCVFRYPYINFLFDPFIRHGVVQSG